MGNDIIAREPICQKCLPHLSTGNHSKKRVLIAYIHIAPTDFFLFFIWKFTIKKDNSKSIIMVFGARKHYAFNFYLRDTRLEVVKSYKYL